MALAFLLVVSAAVGYFHSWLLIKMLFRPRKAYHILGIRVPFTPGLIAARKSEMAQVIAKLAQAEVMNPTNIVPLVLEAGQSGAIGKALSTNKLMSVAWGKYIELFDSSSMSRHVEILISLVVSNNAFMRMVASRLETMSIDEIEEMVVQVCEKELSALTWFGGVLGVMVGLLDHWIERYGGMFGN